MENSDDDLTSANNLISINLLKDIFEEFLCWPEKFKLTFDFCWSFCATRYWYQTQKEWDEIEREHLWKDNLWNVMRKWNFKLEVTYLKRDYLKKNWVLCHHVLGHFQIFNLNFYSVAPNQVGDFFQIFVVFSEKLDFAWSKDQGNLKSFFLKYNKRDLAKEKIHKKSYSLEWQPILN